MANLEQLIKAWDEALWEFSLVFEGLDDADLWKRPHPNLLSVGELTGHVAYWLAVKCTEPAPNPDSDLSQIPIKSVLVDPAFRYYTNQVENPFSLDIGVTEIAAELKRVHQEGRALIVKFERDSEDLILGAGDATWGFYLRYMVFHASYHAGQAYSVRHLFGHTTTDN